MSPQPGLDVGRRGRDALDRALIDRAGVYRDALAVKFGAARNSSGVALTHPDLSGQVYDLADRVRPEGLLRSIEAVLACREALDTNIKPRFALAALIASLIAAQTPSNTDFFEPGAVPRCHVKGLVGAAAGH